MRPKRQQVKVWGSKGVFGQDEVMGLMFGHIESRVIDRLRIRANRQVWEQVWRQVRQQVCGHVRWQARQQMWSRAVQIRQNYES